MQVLDVTLADSGRLAWRLRVRVGSVVDLDYVNSIYNAPTTERFAVTERALRLVEISSTSEAVLDYLAQDPPYAARDGRLVSKSRGPELTDLVVRIGRTGQQRLRVDGRPIPLNRAGVGEALRLEVRRIPRARQMLERTVPP